MVLYNEDVARNEQERMQIEKSFEERVVGKRCEKFNKIAR